VKAKGLLEIYFECVVFLQSKNAEAEGELEADEDADVVPKAVSHITSMKSVSIHKGCISWRF